MFGSALRIRAWLTVSPVVLTLNASTIAEAGVLDIGDSHTGYAATARAFPAWDVDAFGGRNSSAGVVVLDQRLRRRHSEVVFDLATNDVDNPNLFASNLNRVWELLGPRRQLTLVTSAMPGWPGRTAAVNRAIWAFATRHQQRVDVADWSQLAKVHPSWWTEDGIHFTAAGYRRRNQLVRDVMRS